MRNLALPIVALLLVCHTAIMAAQEYGLASVYPTKFQGSRTANGDKFDHNELTAAHRTLPFGSLIKITRTDNGKSVVVRINDRGPFVNNYITDLSLAAARQLGLRSDADEARVKIEPLAEKKVAQSSSKRSISPIVNNPVPMPEPAEYITPKGVREVRELPRDYTIRTNKNLNTAPSPRTKPEEITAKSVEKKNAIAQTKSVSNKSNYAVQVAYLSNYKSMANAVKTLQPRYKNVFVKMIEGKNGQPNYRIYIGTFANQHQAQAYSKNLKRQNIPAFVVEITD